MTEVRGYTTEELDLLVADFANVVQRSIVNALARTAELLQPAVTAAAAIGGVSPDDAATVTVKWSEEVAGELQPYVAQVYTGSAVQVSLGLAEAFPDDVSPGIPLLPDEYALTYMTSVSNRLVNVGDELWEDVRSEIIDGLKKGESIESIRDRIVAVSQFDTTRATRIARTEVHGAAESGNITQLRFMGYEKDEVTKKWLTAHDVRVRMSHVHADGQEAELNDKFIVGGWSLDHPGDPSAPPSETINCRCTMLYDIHEKPKVRCNGGQVSIVAAASSASTTCIVPNSPADLSTIPSAWVIKVFNQFMKANISPAYGGSKIQKTLETTRVWLDQHEPGISAGMNDFQLMAAVDHYYQAKNKKFGEVWHAWLQSPAGKKAVGSKYAHLNTGPSPSAVPISATSTTTPATGTTQTLLSPPTSVFKVLDDPGPSGDGYFPGTHQWGKYGSSGVLIRAVDEHGAPRFLLIQRGPLYIGSQQGKWQLPGGGLDGLEDAYSAAARETMEETKATKEYVESMTPLGEMVWNHPNAPGWKYTTIVAHGDSTFKPVVHGSTGDAKWFTLQELEQMIANDDIIKELKPTLGQLAHELDALDQAHTPPKLPAIAAKPNPADLQYTGTTLGSHGAQVWKHKTTGDKWLFKPQQSFLTDLDIGMAKLQSKAGVTRPAIYKVTLNGQSGSLQYMFESTPAFPGGTFSPLYLSDADLFVMQREQIFDWMISNFDTHSGQWIRLQDGTLYGVDKGQAFKFFGNDSLSWSYVPVTPLGSDKLTYTAIWKDFVKGKNVKLQDPTKGELGAYIDQLMAIDDATYRALLRPYASQVKSGAQLEAFLDAAVARKNDLKKNFEKFWQKALAERNANLPNVPAPPTPSVPPVPAPPTVTPVVITPPTTATATPLSITAKIAIKNEWLALSPTKVTPAWGGAKIYKLLQELKTKSAAQGVDDLTLLRTLTDELGFKGKPKTYESVVIEWLNTDAGKKGAAKLHPTGGIHPSLQAEVDKLAGVAPGVAPVATVPTTPVITTIVDEADDLLTTHVKYATVDMAGKFFDFSDGETMGYAKTLDDGVLKLVKKDDHTLDVLIKQANGTYLHDKYFDINEPGVLVDIQLEYAWQDHVHPWVLKTPNPTFSAPTSAGSKIPGKVPWDEVTPKEIWDSRNLWDDGDIVAVDSTGEWRIVKRNDKLIEERIHLDGTWHVTSSSLDGVSHIDMFKTWKVGPSVIHGAPKTSIFPGKNVGDSITIADEVYDLTQAAGAGLPKNKPLAYAYIQNIDYVFRMSLDNDGFIHVEMRKPSVTHWSDYATLDSKTKISYHLSLHPYHAAKLNGDMPDEVKNAITPAAPTAPPTTVIPPVPVAPPAPAAVAKATKAAKKAAKKSPAPLVLEPSWPSDKMIIPTKKSGDMLTKDEIWDHGKDAPSGTVIATGGGYTHKYRIIVMLDMNDPSKKHLVWQQKTASGNWTTKQIIGNKYQFPTYSWYAKNEQLDVAKAKALQKWIDKKVNPPTYVPPAFVPLSTPTPAVTSPGFTPQLVDLTPWTDTEQKEIYTFMKTTYSPNSGMSNETLWAVLQNVKSHFQTTYGGKYVNLNEAEIIRIFDEFRAAKKGVPNTNDYEKKIVTWLQSPAGRAFVSKRIDAPIAATDVPVPMNDFTATSTPASAQTYNVISITEAGQYASESYVKYGTPLSSDFSAVKTWTGGSYASWNSAIRSGTLGGYKGNIVKTQRAMRPSTRSFLLHRGTGFAELNDPRITNCSSLKPFVGHTYTTRGFTSTSVGGSAAFGGQLLIEIEVPVGTPMVWAQPHSQHPSEREMLLATHLVYQILSVTCAGGQTKMRVRVIGVGQP